MDFLTALEESALATWIRESPSLFAYPMILFLHTIGLGLLAGVSGVICLRILGVAPAIEIRPLERFYPFMWLGFGLAAFSGVLLWIADASTMTTRPLFLVKLGLIVAAMVTVRLIRGRGLGSESPDFPAKALALTSIVLWLGAITAGRLTAYFK